MYRYIYIYIIDKINFLHGYELKWFLFLVDQVKKRMKSLRTQFGKLRKPGRSGSEAKPTSKKNKWILDHLQFLTPHMVVRTTTSNLEVILQ